MSLYTFLGKKGHFYKLNANCSKDVKQGEGPGSCGGQNENEPNIKIDDIYHSKSGKYVVFTLSNNKLDTKIYGKSNIDSEGRNVYTKEFSDLKSAKEFRNQIITSSNKSTEKTTITKQTNTNSDKKLVNLDTLNHINIKNYSSLNKSSESFGKNSKELDIFDDYSVISSDVNNYVYKKATDPEYKPSKEDDQELGNIAKRMEGMLSRFKTTEDTVLYRGISDIEINRLYKLENNKEYIPKVFSFSTMSEDVANEYAVTKDGKKIVAEFRIPKGTSGIVSMVPMAKREGQTESIRNQEVLMDKDIKYEKLGTYEHNNELRIVLKVKS